MDAPPAKFARTTDGLDVAYLTAGDGPVLIRTPNLWGHVSRQWDSDFLGGTFEALAERYRLVLYDARGQGLSSRILSDSLSIDDYVDDLTAVADSVADRFVLMGWSTGCTTAIKFAVDNPDRVSGLVLWEYRNLSHWEPLIELASRSWRFYVETSARVAFPDFNPEQTQEMLLDAMTQEDHLKQWRALRSVNVDELLLRVTVPTVVIASRPGSRPGSDGSEPTRAAAMISGAQLAFFDGKNGLKKTNDGTQPGPVEATWLFTHTLLEQEPATEKDEKAETTADHSNGLSGREVQVLRLISAGLNNNQIANELSISRHTVNRHVSNVYSKIQVSNRAAATSYAVRNGLT